MTYLRTALGCGAIEAAPDALGHRCAVRRSPEMIITHLGLGSLIFREGRVGMQPVTIGSESRPMEFEW